MRPRSVPLAARALGGLLALALAGCSALTDPRRHADAIARAGGLEAVEIDAAPFRLLSFRRESSAGGELRIFIEGDGRAWSNRYRPPRDPTPRDPVALRLAAADRAASVVYLARPCQFVVSAQRCDARWWTSHRYAEPVIDAYDRAIDAIVDAHPPTTLTLVGHSGGGVIAALVAARRDDVARLVTVAAPLSLGDWTTLLDLAPLDDCLDPAAQASRLARIAQLHLVGGQDAVVPSAVVQRYLARLRRPRDAAMRIVDDADHQCCWERLWPSIVPAGI